jgi:hypothetical protein
MSNIALVSPATGTATFSITTPSGTSTDRTLTLPDNSGTVATSGISGVDSVPVGRGAGNVSTNTAVGASALAANTSGANNVVVGYQAGDAITTGALNTAIGSTALSAITTTNNNTAVGAFALDAATGSGNTGIGSGALGASGNTADNNTAVGFDALNANTTASSNTAVGQAAGYSNTTGAGNTFVGRESGYYITTGSSNTILGRFDGNSGGLDIRTSSNNIVLSDGSGNPRVWVNENGVCLLARLSTAQDQPGFMVVPNDYIAFTNTSASSGDRCVLLNRQSADGVLIEFRQANINEGNISVSGTTVSYNGGHLSRWAQTTTAKDESLVKGTVLSNLDEMNVYTDAEGNPVQNEQLNKVKVSDVEGDANVAGVFVNWTHDDAHDVDEINMAMTGDMIIRIAQGVTVQRGDLLMSAGDGTAKPQGDDIVRSKTIAKVTSTHITCTYADGSYCVPCVLMAC